MCSEETGVLNGWVMTDHGGAAEKDTEVGMSHLQSDAINGVLKESQQQSNTVTEIKCVAKGQELELAAEDIDAINGTMFCLSDIERQLNNLWIELGLEDVNAIMPKEMDIVKLFMEFPIEISLTVV